ncbi:TrkH family potassium uptake protein [Ruficoccus amylovorans]|uniref:TrkH family potassium uptake protein n=1 Tax=Ruficoccus amylovorans TaxID=1804625 RepID=A0A842HEK7_9BACT|nr:TrkH family potassium uptake protein [Ruficoccus amylovorans]MBC2594086.1 TrkH family potassium uptake protein [Ruficoccus amylovorans]
MNYRIISKLLSVIVTTLAVAFLICLGMGQTFDTSVREDGVLDEWLICSAVAVALALICMLLGRGAGNKLLRKEALAVIGLGWILASVIGALPYYLILEEASVADSIFETASGLTTTGASVFSNLESIPTSLLFWRCLSQWIGGLGVVVFFVALLSSLGAGAKILFSNESSGHSTDIDSGRVQHGVLQIMYVYLGLSALCAVVFHLCGMNWFDALCHMFATVSTGGFSTYNSSVGAFQSPTIEWMVTLFMALGGTSFFVMLRMVKCDFRHVWRNTEFIAYLIIMGTFSILITLILLGEGVVGDFNEALRVSTFQAVSLMTSTGFSTADFQMWPNVVHTLLMMAMIVGGCSGSTGGGTKVVRVVVALKVARQQIERAFRTRVVRPMHMNGRILDKDDQENVINYIVLLAIVCLLSLPVLALLQHELSFEGCFSAMLACLFNVGPGFNEVGPTLNYSYFSEAAKIFLALLMIMGRLELYAVLVLFTPSLWKRFS